jgi:hypothetical protein
VRRLVTTPESELATVGGTTSSGISRSSSEPARGVL